MPTIETGRRVARIVPYAEREPLYAAYRAAHEQTERVNGCLTDDSIIQAAVKAYEAKLIQQRRLLPAPAGDARRYALDAADVEAYVKRRRDAEITCTDAWYTLDGLLDDLRDHLYTGTPLDQEVEGPTAPGEQ